MIAGIGTDLIAIDRIAAVLERHGTHFVERILGDEELAIYHQRAQRSQARGVAFLATRFAAKEAFSKAIGLGMRSPMTWRAVQFLKHPSGQPHAVVNAELSDWMSFKFGTDWKVHVSLSDERALAQAWVLVEAQIKNHHE